MSLEEEMDLRLFKNNKKALKTRLTRFTKYIDSIDGTSNIQTNELDLRLANITPVLDLFYEVQGKIEVAITAIEVDESQNIETEAFEDTYFKYISKGKALLELCTNTRTPNEGHYQNNILSNAQVSSEVNVKLPPIPLPSFDGSYEQWLFFKDTFKSLIHDNESIPDVQKFHYLRLSLKGSAAELLKSLESSPSNYVVAWNLLEKRYENTQILVRFHIKALFDLNNVKEECHQSLRSLLDGLNKHIRALEVLKQPVAFWDALLIHMISLKLDSATRREWESEYSKHDLVSLEGFTTFLNDKCKLLETIQINNPQKAKRHSFPSLQVNHRTPICSLCNKDHTVYNCKTFLDFNSAKRLAEAKKRKWCLNCLRINHSTEQCRSTPCRKCSSKHNTLLHNGFAAQAETAKKAPEQQPTTPKVNNDSSFLAQNEEMSQNITGLHSVQSHSASAASSRVLLSTALVDISDVHGNTHLCRVMLDSGSESSFITQNLCEKLGLKRFSTNISISGIGQSVSKVVEQTSVKIQARSGAYDFSLNCLVLPQISRKIPYVY